jgi:hypothetical protein
VVVAAATTSFSGDASSSATALRFFTAVTTTSSTITTASQANSWMSQRPPPALSKNITLRIASRPDVRGHLQASLVEGFVTPLAARFDGPDALLRAHLFAAQATGLMFGLSVYDDEFLISAPTDEIVEIYGGSLQRAATG